MSGEMSEFSGIAERDRDTIGEMEILNSSFEEISPALGPIQQHEFDAGLLQRHHKPRHSPAAPEIAPALTGHRSSCHMVSSCVLHMGQEVTGAKKALLLTVSEHGNQAFFCHRHDAWNRISDVSRETLRPRSGSTTGLR